MFTKDSFVAMLSQNSKLSALTIRNRASFLFKQYREIGDNAGDLSYINRYSEVIKHINDSAKNDEGRKTYLFHVIGLFNTDAGKVIDDDTRKKFLDAAQLARERSKKQSLENVATPKQQTNYVSIDDLTIQLESKIQQLFADYGLKQSTKISNADFAKWDIGSDRKNIKSFARELQRCIMLACYCYQPALRSDWSTLRVSSGALKSLDPSKNWIQILRNGRIRLVMNDFKNVASFGKHIIDVESARLKRHLKYWINLLERLLEKKPEYLFIYQLSPILDVKLVSNSREAFAKAIARNSVKLFDKPQTVNSFRHAWEKKIQDDSSYQGMTQAQRQTQHSKLLHSTMMGQAYNLKDRE